MSESSQDCLQRHDAPLHGPSGGVRHVYLHCLRSMDQAAPFSTFACDPAIYTDRSLLMASPGDIVCLHEPPDAGYLNFLNRLGLGPRPADVVICPDLPDDAQPLPLPSKLMDHARARRSLIHRLRGAPRVLLHTYLGTRFERALAELLEGLLGVPVRWTGGDAELIAFVDRKHHVRQLAVQLGIPVAPGHIVNTREPSGWEQLESRIRRQMGETGKVIVRGAVGSTGVAVHRLVETEDVAEAVRRIRRLDGNWIFLVETMYELTASPNVAVHIHPESRAIQIYSCSEQVLQNGVAHAGNHSPVTVSTLDGMVAAAQRLAAWLRDRGATGHLGLDFCEHELPSGDRRFFLAELNPRVNGATYAQHVLNALNHRWARFGGPPLRAYRTLTCEVPADHFLQLETLLAPWLWRPGADAGLLPARCVLLREGRCYLLIVARSAQLAQGCEREVREFLSGRVTRQSAPPRRRAG